MSYRIRSRTHGLKVSFTLALGIVLVACGKSGPSNSNSGAALPTVMATVNDRPISSKLYEMYLKNGSEDLGLNTNTEEGRRKLDLLREGIVSELIDRVLIAQEAERRGLPISAERMSQAERQAIADLGGEQQYDPYLAGHRLTRDEYREVVKMQVYGEMMRSELNKGLVVTEAQIAAEYHEANQSERAFQQPERVTAAHILIAARPNLISQQLQREKGLTGEALERAVREEVDRRRRRAEELRRKATAPSADFAALARQTSEDPGTSVRGGDLGTFGRNSHPRAFDEAAFALKPGQVSAVVETEYGFHVIKVSAHEPARVQRLAEAAPEIRRRLFAEGEAKNLTEWLREARRKATIRINEPFRFGALKNEFPPA